MKKANNDPTSMLPLTPATFHILLALVNNDQHGYGIMKEIAERTEQRVNIGAGTLYGAIKRLLAQGLIIEVGERPDPELDDERRRYYRLTEFGSRVVQAEAERLADLVRQLQAKQLLPQLNTR